MFVLREAKPGDEKSLQLLAEQLGGAGSLSSDLSKISHLIELSERSFRQLEPKETGKYLFVLENVESSNIVGCSMITGKMGRPDDPNTYLHVLNKTHEDPSTNVSKTHQLLRFEFDEDGPSMIGGLILDQDHRSGALGLGRLLSWGRFLYMGMNLDRFETSVIAELLPPFNEQGESELWEAFGRRFTDMSYQEADRLSRTNKDFIKNLFPQEDIYTGLFDEKARSVIGKTGSSTRAAQRLLEKVGFFYTHIVDPFDGGPQFAAKLREITIVKRMQRARISHSEMTSRGNKSLVGGVSSNGFFCFSTQTKKELKDLYQIDSPAKSFLKSCKALDSEVYVVSPL